MGGKVIVVVGGQLGSEGKGEVAGWLVDQEIRDGREVMAVRVAGPNAGHTVTIGGPRLSDFLDSPVRSYAFRHLPVAAVVAPKATLAIAAGSEIDPEVLEHEIREVEEKEGIEVRNRLLVDPSATVIDREYLQSEMEMATQGRSTGKGIGAARAARIMRRARTWGDHGIGGPGRGGVVAGIIREELATGTTVLVEGTQGYGLGVHTPYYPQTTSSDCRAIDFLAMAGISPWATEVDQVEVWVVARTRAIRIAGDSGPLDEETTWEELGLEPQLTTVTKKVRRIGGLMPELIKAAIVANGGPGDSVRVAMTHMDHLFPDGTGQTEVEVGEWARWLQVTEGEIGSPIHLLGMGPGSFVRRLPW